jgi:hypothetical protein
MAFDYRDIIVDKHERLQAQRQQTLLELEIARQREDIDGTRYAADQIIAIDGEIERVHRTANAYVSQQQGRIPADFAGLTREQSRLAVKAGLTGDQAQIALNTTRDSRLSDADKMVLYAEGLQKYNEWRDAGNKDDFDLQGKNHPGRR